MAVVRESAATREKKYMEDMHPKNCWLVKHRKKQASKEGFDRVFQGVSREGGHRKLL
jgi:hypothetical protein